MEHQKLKNLLDNTKNKPFKFRTRNLVEVNDELRESHGEDNQVKFETSMIRSHLRDYSNVHILVSRTITIDGEGDSDVSKLLYERNKGAKFKYCAPFTECVSNTNNTEIDNSRDIDVVMPIYKLIQYSDNYSNISGSLCQFI